MKRYTFLLFIASLTILLGCKSDKQSSQQPKDKTTENVVKDISELTYIEIYRILFANNNGGFDAHGDLYGQDALLNLSISEEKGTCGNDLYLTNASTNQSINLAVKASFNFPGNPNNEMIRAYTVSPSEKISIGTTLICYGGNEYTIKRDIVSAGFVAN